MKIARLFAGAALATAAVSLPAQAQVNIKGTTTGCFFQGSLGNQCSTGTQNATAGNLTFTGGSFDVTVGQGGWEYFDGSVADNVGRLQMSPSDFNFDPSGDNNRYGFRLFVTITQPVTTPGGVNLVATFDGNVNIDQTGDDVDFNFSDTFTNFSYAGGSFQFRALDENIARVRNATSSQYMGFKIYCSNSQNSGPCDPPTQVPEPASVSLVAAGLAGLLAMSRRRRRNNV